MMWLDNEEAGLQQDRAVMVHHHYAEQCSALLLMSLTGTSVPEFHEVPLNAYNNLQILSKLRFLLVATKEFSCIYIEKLQFHCFDPSKFPHFLSSFIINKTKLNLYK